MKSILIAVDLSGSMSIDGVRHAVSECTKNLCPSAKIDFCAFDCIKLQFVDQNFFFGMWYKEFGAGTSIDLIEPFFNDYDQVIIVTDGYMERSVLVNYPDVSLFITEEA